MIRACPTRVPPLCPGQIRCAGGSGLSRQSARSERGQVAALHVRRQLGEAVNVRLQAPLARALHHLCPTTCHTSGRNLGYRGACIQSTQADCCRQHECDSRTSAHHLRPPHSATPQMVIIAGDKLVVSFSRVWWKPRYENGCCICVDVALLTTHLTSSALLQECSFNSLGESQGLLTWRMAGVARW